MLILSDGTELSGHAFVVGGVLWVYVSGMDICAVFDLLRKPKKTAQIRNASMGDTYTGYTKIMCVRREADGQISAGLTQA